MSEERPHRRRDRGTDLSDGQLIATGEVAFWATRAERTLGLVVSALVNERSEAGAIVTNGMPFGRLLDLGTQLVALRPVNDQVRDLFTRFSGPLKAAMESRNHLMHGEWTTPREGPPVATRTQGKRTSEREFPLEAIESVATDLALMSNRLYVLWFVIIKMTDYEEWAPPDFSDNGTN